MKSGKLNKRRCGTATSNTVAGLAAAVVLCLLSGCNKEIPKPENAETPPEPNLEKVIEKAIPVEMVVEDTAPIIERDCQVSIVGYHDFTQTNSPTPMRIREAKFREQMQAIKDADIPVIPLRDYMAWRKGELQIPKRAIVITADDGWREFHTYALPILKEFGYPFTMYIYTDFLNNGGRSLSDEQVKEMLAANGEIGSHGVSHKLMTTNRGFASDEAFEAWLVAELKDSKEELEKRYEVPVTSFAYPFGAYNERLVEFTRKAGYESAVTVNGSRAHYDVDLMEVPRYIIHGNSDANWNMATNFRGAGGLAKANNLLQEQEDEEGVKQPSLVKTWPGIDEVIQERMPSIQVDLSSLEGIVLDSVKMEVAGFGTVPAEFDANTKVLRWKVPRKIRMNTTTVTVRLQRQGVALPDLIIWDFRIDRAGLYLNEPSKEKPSEDVALTGIPDAVEVRRPLPVE